MGSVPKSQYLSAFLSYTHDDKDVVYRFADELGRWGILPWIDETHMRRGDLLDASVRTAIEAQTAFVVFLSPKAIESGWVRRELEHAAKCAHPKIIAVFLGISRKYALNTYDWLREWALPLRERFDIEIGGGAPPEDVEKYCQEIAQSCAARAALHSAVDVAIYLDQRGAGRRANEPGDLPPAIVQSGMPVLVFRTDRAPRSPDETQPDLSKTYLLTLGERLGAVLNQARPTLTLHICGNAQLGFTWRIGEVLGDYCPGKIRCYTERCRYQGARPWVDNEGWLAPQQYLKHSRYSWSSLLPFVEHSQLGTDWNKVVVILGSQGRLPSAIAYLKAHESLSNVNRLWIEVNDILDSDTAANDVRRIVTLLETAQHLTEIYLINMMPFHVTPLLTAQLTGRSSFRRIRYIEYRKDLAAKGSPDKDLYAQLVLARSGASNAEGRR